MKVFKCPICGTVAIKRRRFKTCSQKCGQALLKLTRGADYHRKAGHVAGKAAGIVTRQRCAERRRQRWPGVNPELGQRIYTVGYNSGHQKGRRLGFQQGYEAALSGLRLEKAS